MKKIYVLDTNIILHNPDSVYGFDDNTVVVTGTTLQELDVKKDDIDPEVRYNAREAGRLLDDLRELGDLHKGVMLPNGGLFRIEIDGVSHNNLPFCYNIKKADNQIISTCVYLKDKYKEPVILVSSDRFMRVSASIVLGFKNVEKYKNNHVLKDEYTGHIDLDVSAEFIDNLFSCKIVDLPDSIISKDTLHENEFVTLHADRKSALSVYTDGKLELVSVKPIFGNTSPKNAMQTYAIWALTQPAERIPFVILQGPAGTAKTYLSLAAGLDGTYTSQNKYDGTYRKMMITRPNSEAGDAGFGYLPGDLDDKMGPLLAPYYDNLETLFLGGNSDEDRSQIKMQIDDLFDNNVIECCALSYIRGRSINNAYMICDEAQNATKKLIKDVVTRAGNQTKIIICGDPEQCDNPKLDSRSNGLVHAAKAFKDSKLACLITFDTRNSVRSPLAKEAIDLM